MTLRRMDKEGMAKINGPRLTGRNVDRPVGAHFAKIHVRHACFARGLKEPGHIHM